MVARIYVTAFLVLTASLSWHAARAQNATCTCTCFDGRPLQVCSNPNDAPICGPEVCPPKPSLVQPPPLQSPALQPPSEKVCKLEPILNESTGQNEVRMVCK